MNVNFGLFPPVEIPKGPDGKKPRGKDKQIARKHAYTSRALARFRSLARLRAAIAAGVLLPQNDPEARAR